MLNQTAMVTVEDEAVVARDLVSEEEVVGVLGEKATLVSIAISIVMECQRKMPVVSRAFKINGPPFRT